MDDNNIYLIIKIEYDNDIYELKTDNKISYKQLIQQSLDYFKIDREEEEFIQFSYIDEDGDKNFLGKEENEIFEA